MSDVVLIADSDAVRGKRIAAACSARGLACSLTSHGAGALEIALADNPVAMVAQVDLPLIDGLRLCEILRANPRTRDLAVLFVGERRPNQKGAEEAGRTMPGHADPDTIARFVEALLAKRRKLRDGQRSEPGGGVEGQLEQLSLGELLEIFHLNRRTGVVELRRGGGGRRSEQGTVHLRNGEIVQAAVGAVAGEKALFRLLAWDRGRFAFCAGPVTVERGIERSAGALLREGRRQAAEWDQLTVELPPRHAHLSLKVSRASLPNVMHPLTQEVLLVLELCTRVEDVLDRCAFPDYQVLRTLHTLVRRGMVEVQLLPESGEGAPDDALFTPAQAARLRDWLDRGRNRGRARVDAKLLVLGPDAEALRRVSDWVGRLPGGEPLRPTDSAFVAPLARLEVDDELGIDWVGVDVDPRARALWPFAAHGALGIVMLESDGGDAASAPMEEARRVLEALPRSRIFSFRPEGEEPGDGADGPGHEEPCAVGVAPTSPDRAAAALRRLLVQMLP